MRTTAVLAVLLAAAAATRAAADDELPPEFRRLLPLHQPLPEPRPGDWLHRHDEPGQTYGEYLAVNVSSATARSYPQAADQPVPA